MKKWLRRIRGAIGTGVTWAAAWWGVGVIIALVFLGGGLAAVLSTEPLFLGVLGFISGAGFSGMLAFAEGRRTFDEMSLPRFAGLGAVPGLLLSALLASEAGGSALDSALLVGVVTLLGAGSAAGSLALARRAHDDGLLDADEEATDVGLSEKEKRELLGKA